MAFVVNWLIAAIAIVIVAHVIPGFHVQSFGTAMIAAVVIGLVNATIGLVVQILALPLTILTFGLFYLVVNAFMLQLASWMVPGFQVDGFLAAFIGGLLISIVGTLLKQLFWS